ncbi:MAG: SRPBCC domain-containing protein [Bacteroidales bacterium]|nr:SRPBCC domain-containing protein [Bacteroidales bacterium]
MATKIKVEVLINNTLEKVWSAWITPSDIEKWYFASPDWYVPAAENDLRVGGRFKTVMSSRDKTMGFDFEGTYTEVNNLSKIVYVLADERVVETTFTLESNGVKVTQIFDPETENPIEMQQYGWQCILENFKIHVDSLS